MQDNFSYNLLISYNICSCLEANRKRASNYSQLYVFVSLNIQVVKQELWLLNFFSTFLEATFKELSCILNYHTCSYFEFAVQYQGEKFSLEQILVFPVLWASVFNAVFC